MAFMIGDHVQLKSSDKPCMTIIERHPNDHWTCCWFDGAELQEMVSSTEELITCTAIDENVKILGDILYLPSYSYQMILDHIVSIL